MWCSTDDTGMICQSFDTTWHYHEEHNYGYWKKKPCTVKSEVTVFYLNGSESNAALREYRRMKGLRREPMSTNGLKKMMMKFENNGNFGVAPGRGRRPIPMEVVNEVAVAVADRAECVPNSATSARAVSRELCVPWSTVRKILCCILHWYTYKIQIVQQLKPHDPQQRLGFVLQFLARIEEDDMWSMLILQAFSHFTYVTAHSPTLPSFYLRDSSFSNSSVASPTSQLILQPFFRFS